jgi:hypothetical protein
MQENKLMLMSIVDRCIRIVIQNEITMKKSLCDVFIEPSANNDVTLLQLRTTDFLFETVCKEMMLPKYALLNLMN